MAAFLWLLPSMIMAEDVIQIGSFNKDAAIVAAEAKGFLNKENIRIQTNLVTDSPTLLRNLISGKYDLILNNADNVIAWAEQTPEEVRDLIQRCGRVVLVVRQKEDVERCRVLFAADRRFRTLAAVGDIQVMIGE